MSDMYQDGETVIAVDLDGTLAEYFGWQGEEHIGQPVWPLVEKIKKMIESDDKIVFWIYSARCCDARSAEIIHAWKEKHGISELFAGVTNIKYKFFREFWDDRAKQVVPNTGVFVGGDQIHSLIKTLSDDEISELLGITPKALKVARYMSLPVFNTQVGGSHYKNMVIEPGIYCELNGLSSFESGVVKYVSRHRNKNGAQDIDKAGHLIEAIRQTCYGKDEDAKE